MVYVCVVGVIILFDINLWLCLWLLECVQVKMVEVFCLCDVCLLSWEDVLMLIGFNDWDVIVDYLLDYGVKLVVFKLGYEGCYVVICEECWMVVFYLVQVLDVMGVGDCFGGVFMVELMVGCDFFVVVCYVNVVVVFFIIGYGVVDFIFWWEQVEVVFKVVV